MAHPEWALMHKTKGTELRLIRGKYYLYEITSKWDKEAKKTRKITLRQIGTITEEHGLVPTGLKKRGRPASSGSVFNENVFAEIKNESKQKSEKIAPLLNACTSIEDMRSERNQLHSIPEILFLTLMALISDADGWQDMETYGNMRTYQLKEYLDYKHGTPSDDTLRRFFTNLDPSHFKNFFCSLVQPLIKQAQAKLISIDGKVSRHSFDGEEKAIHMVSAFSSEARLVLGQEKVGDKTNEITAIPKILEWLDIKNRILTIDAMGCQHAIADQIVEKGGDYVFSLKGNQGNLSEDVSVYFNDIELTDGSEKGSSKPAHTTHYTDVDKGHGRIETRACSICLDVAWLQERHPKWCTIKSIIQIKSTREMKNTRSTEVRYYISSLVTDAQEMLKNIRSHWAIENSLHWVLDMTFHDDASRIRKDNAPQIMAILRHLVLNALQLYRASLPKSEKISIKGLRKMCAWDPSLTEKVVSRLFS